MATILAFRHIANLWEVGLSPEVVTSTLAQYLASSEHARDAGAADSGIAFQFNIRYRRVNLPAQVYTHVDQYSIEEEVNNWANVAIDDFCDSIKERHDWIEDTGQVGRSGGWLVVIPKYPGVLEPIIYDSSQWIKDVESGAVEHEDYLEASTIAQGLIDLDQEVQDGVRAFVRNIESIEFWRGYLPGQTHQASETFFDGTSDVGDQPEDRTFVNPLDDKKLRRTNPKRYDIRHDLYYDHENGVQDTDISNRYDNPVGLVSSLDIRQAAAEDIGEKVELLDWEIDRIVETAQLGFRKIAEAEPSITLEAATPEDIKELAALHQQAFAKYPVQPPNYFAESSLLRGADYFVARELANNKIVGGFVSRWSPERKTNEMVQILVDPTYQGKGLGHKLMAHFEDLHPEAQTFSLNTPDFAEGNHKFYQGLGYSAKSRYKIPGEKPVTLVTYQKERADEDAKLAAQLLQRSVFAKMFDALWSRNKQKVGDVIPYAEFPEEVKSFIAQHFAKVFSEHPEVKDTVENLKLEFMVRPKYHKDFPDVPYRGSIGGEYFPEESKIGFYLKPRELKKNWYGIVHELAHVIQVALGGKHPDVPSAPDKTKRDYYADNSVYHKDPGEQHAYATQEAFLRYSDEGAK